LAKQPRAVPGAIAGLAAGGVLLSASVITLGVPNLALAGGFLDGSYPSMQSAIAFLSLLCYVVVGAAVAVAILSGLRMASGGRGTSRGIRAIALVLAGVILLSLSVISRVDTGNGICCGGGAQQVREAESLAR
jgi:hypothetical protein